MMPLRPRRDEHAEYRLLAAAAVDGRLDPDGAAALEAHLATCDACRADQAAMLADHAWLADPAAAAMPAPAVRALVLDAARAPRVPRTGAPARPWPALAAASLILAVAGAGLLLGRIQPDSGGGGTPTAPATPPSPGIAVEGCVPIPSGLSVRWAFDGNPIDRVAAIEASVVGSAHVEDGVSGAAIRLVGAATAVDVAETEVSQLGAGDFTLSLWVRFATLEGEQVLLERRSESPVVGWTLTKLANDEIRLALAASGGEISIDTRDAGLGISRWHNVTARRDGAGFAVFVDGVRRGSSELPPGASAELDAPRPMHIGRRSNDGGLNLQGDVDEVLIWRGRALSNPEIAGLRKVELEGFCEAAAGAGYAGTWVTTDCPTVDGRLECARWGDGSNLRLTIGEGERPSVEFRDDVASGCGPSGAAGERLAVGTGHFEGVHLLVDFTEVGCGAPAESWANPLGLYKAPGLDELWADPDGDGFGLLWHSP